MKKLLSGFLAASQDLAGFLGIGATAYGAWLIHEPAGFIVGGLMLFGLAVIPSILSSRRPGP